MVGKFIVVEGLEGAGKTTAVQIIKCLLEEKGFEVVCTRELGGTPFAEKLRAALGDDSDGETVHPISEALTAYAARAQLVKEVIVPALEKGKWVIGDRHNLSTIAYQGGGGKIDVATLAALKELAIGDFEPDYVIYMDIEPEIGLGRARARGALDRFEKQDLEYFHRVHAAYLNEVAKHDNYITVSSGDSNIAAVAGRLRDAVEIICWKS